MAISRAQVVHALDADDDGHVSPAEWLRYVKAQAERNGGATRKLLKAYAAHLGEATDFEAARDEAARRAEEEEYQRGEQALRVQNELRRRSMAGHEAEIKEEILHRASEQGL